MRRGIWGIREIMLAVLMTVILIIIAVVLVRLVGPASSSSANFGKQAAEVLG